MNEPVPAAPASAGAASGSFWERLWRLSGLGFILFFAIAYILYGQQPGVGASADTLAAFYTGGRTQILIGACVGGMAVLNLMWFAAALRTTLASAGCGGWGAAATAASATVGALFLLLLALDAALAYSIAGAGDSALTGLNQFAWALLVMTAFPRAMLIMSGSFGLWRSGLISNAMFAAGVACIFLALAGATTWLDGGVWAPDGAYSRFISPAIGLLWILAVTPVLLKKGGATGEGW